MQHLTIGHYRRIDPAQSAAEVLWRLAAGGEHRHDHEVVVLLLPL